MNTEAVQLDPWQQMRVEQALDLVEQRALHYAKRHRALVDHDDLDDLRSIGSMALIKAALGYDEASKAKFRTYARWRIDGAMLDRVRALSFDARVKRSMLRAQVHFLADAAEDADPMRGEMATARHLDAECRGLLDAVFMAGAEEAAKPPHPEDEIAARDEYLRACAALREALGAIDPGDKQVLVMVYVEDRFLVDVAQALKLDESTVRRRHKRGLGRLGTELQKRGITRAPPRPGPSGAWTVTEPAPEGPSIIGDERPWWREQGP